MMHLIIAKQVHEKLGLLNLRPFILGGIAPDAVFLREKKDASHFYGGHVGDKTRFVDYERFIEKYLSNIHHNFMLGYLTHIISDDVWLKKIYFKNNFQKRLIDDPDFLTRWHNDFRLLNGKLVEWFNCANLMNELDYADPNINSVEEIEIKDLIEFKKETLGDFLYTRDQTEKDLAVYRFDDIIDYIESSTVMACEICSKLIPRKD
ncbi:hydrolase [Virgibacillus phasianinus]|uniref:Hydrolase n=1 Tax=Virgibacillus phasianinus TaxID=2017483 RepID=A0A220U118_9BACI|nr:zinc dependent phospholipase C family protein [Virgibacillus phasianinus]ASK61807.1 hydrolase [Virgibacillus phasianinus]